MKDYLKMNNKQFLCFSGSIHILQNNWYTFKKNGMENVFICEREKKTKKGSMEESEILTLYFENIYKDYEIIGFKICPPRVIIKSK